MATRKEIAQNQRILYDDAVANNMFQAAVPTFKEFQKRLEGQGYQKMVFDNYKKHNVRGKGFNNLNEFRGAFGGSFYADENKIGVSNRTASILSGANNAVRQAKRNIQTKLGQAKKFNSGRVTPHLKNPLQNQNVQKNEFNYNSTTGKTGTYTTTDGVEFDNEYDATQYQNKLDKYGEEWNNAVDMGIVPSELDKADPDLSDTDVAMRQMERRQEWLNENQDRRSKELNESMHLQDSPFVASGGAVAPSSFNTAISNEANRLSDVEYGAYNTAKAYNQMLRTTLLQELKEQKQSNENAGWWKDKWNDVSNYFGAMFNTMLDPKLYSQGVMDAAISNNLLQVKKGMEDGTIKKGSNAGNAAQAMLGAIQQQQGEAAKQQQYGTKAYQYGDMSGRSLKFMGDFALSGWRNVMTTGFTKAGEKVGEKMALGALGKWFTKNTGRVLGDIAGSAALAATNQLGSTYNNVIERYVGMNNENGGVTQDKNGDLKFNEGVSLGKAIKDGFGSATIENFSEMFGEYLPGAPKLLSKLGLSKVSAFFEKIGNNAYYKWLSNATNKSGIQGVMAEISEEEFGTALHAAWGDGDGSWSDFNVFTNPDAREKQIDTCLGMFYSVGFMQAPRTAVGAINAVQYFNIKHQVAKADKFGQVMFNDKWDEVKSKIDVTTNADLTKTVLDATRSDSMTAKQKDAVINYAMFLSKLRGFNQAADAKTKDKVEEGDTAPTLSNDLDDAYTEGHNADDADKHNIQLEQNDKANELAAMLHITPEQLHDMADEDLETMTGQDDKLDKAIYDYQVSTAKYQGVMDGAQDEVDMAAHQAAMETDNMTDLSRGTVRKATIKATGGLEDYEVYIISGNIATHDDGSIDVGNSDDMIIYYDPTTGRKEHADAMMFADLIEELPAADVKAQAVADAKENAIKKIAGIVDGTIDVGSQFSVTDADGTEHTYEVLADNGDGMAMITIDGNVPTELVKGENVQIPYSFADLQQLKDAEDLKRLEAAKTQREQMEKERAEQQTQETEQPEETQPSLDFNQILNDNGNVVLVDVLDKDGNTKYPDSKLFLIRDTGAKAKVVEMKSDGTFVPHAVSKKDVATISSMSLDEYKQAMAETSMIEENSGAIEGDRGGIEVNDELPPVPDNVTINGDGTYSVDGAVQGGENTTAPSEQTEQTPAMTLEDGTIVPMLEDGNPDFSKLTADQTAELYDSQFGEDADSVISGFVSDAKKALDKANNMTVKGKNFVEQKAAKEAKEKAIADAQAAYDSAIAIRDAYNSRQLAKVEDDADGRKNLIEKARRKFSRLKSAVKDDAEAVSQLYKDVVGSLLHRLYDGTGIDVTDTIPLTAEEYVASNLGAHSLNYEGTETSKGVKQETGLSREDFTKTQLLAADGKGTTIDDLVHSLWENRPSNLESLDTQDIRNALIDVLNSGFKASEARNYIENLRIAQAENILEEQKKAADNAAFAEEQTAPAEEQTETALESEQINDKENEQTNEQNKFPDKLREGSKAIEVPEDATEENPLGAQREQTDLPFSARDNGTQQTTSERAADVEKNKVDDMKVVDNIVGEKTRKAFERLAKMMGANVQWQYSDKLGNGWIQETKDADGNVHRTIFITLDSSITEGAQFIFGHEMTHQIKSLNPAAYNELTQLVLDTYGSDAFDKAIDETMQRYSDAGFSGRARDYYAEEVVADAVGEMIRDLNLAHTLAMKMSHPLLAAIHEILQKIKLAFFGTEYSDVTKNIIRSIEQAYVKTANGEVTNSETGEDVSFSLRQKPEPKKKGIGYKVFVLKDGKLYPPMVANPDGAATPVGVWLDADAAPIAGESKTGRPQVKQGGKGTQGGSGKLAYRPGWHLGVVPYAIQFNRKDAEGNKTLFPKNFVFAEVEYAADVDYQEEARQEGINPSGKYQHSLAGLKHLPTDGYYMYRTNPNPETDPWVITGAMKVNRILTRAEQAELVKNAGREPQQIQDGDIVTDDIVNSINQEIADAPKFSLKVYHGSGADFTEFDFDHMGEGAGSQVFGWGGYVTSSKKIGKSYATLMDNDPSKAYYRIQRSNGTRFAKKYPTLESFLHGDKQIAMNDKFTEQEKIDYYNEMKKLAEPYHNLYEVDIPDDNGSNYLDWDKPLSKKQQDAIREGLEHLGVGIKTLESKGQSLERTGENVYNSTLYIGLTGTEYDLPERTKGISKFLSSVGFTGIKYKAGRNFGGAKKGDTNYVIFMPEDMKITEHTKFSIKTYHGSQASFDKFDHSFMGSGEGAQAYGWGTYVSEVEGIAKAYAKSNATIHSDNGYKEALYKYREADFNYHITETSYKNAVKNLKEKEQLAHPKIKNLEKELEEAKSSGDTISVGFLETALKNWNEVLRTARKEVSKYEDTILPNDKDVLEKAKKRMEELMPDRNLYSVDIPDDTGRNYIVWDEPLGAAKIMRLPKVFKAYGWEHKKIDVYGRKFDRFTKYANGKEIEGQIIVEPSTTGGELYKGLTSDLGSDKAASEFLSKAGFVGVKVIAQRNAGGNKAGRMNYVIFDENNAQITSHTKFSLKKDGMRSLLDVDGKPVVVREENGNVDLNYRTWQDEKELVRDALVTDAGLEEDEADAMIAQADVVADAMKSYMDKYPRFRDYQYAPAGNREIIRDNGDYLSWDYSFNCIKKDAMNAVMDKLVSLGKSSHLGVTQVEAIKKILQKHKFLTPCVMCYVEGKRKVLKQSKADAQKWNSVREYAGLENKEMGEPTELTDEQQNALKNLSNGKAHIDGIDDYSVQKIANLMLDNDILRGNLNYEWMMSPSSFTQMYNKFGNTDLMKYMTLGQYRGKQLLEATPFSINNIPRELYLKMYSALELKERGGLRQFSYEDARAMMFFDYYTQFLLMQGARSPEHLYTKRPFMPEMFGKTGAMINQSLIVDVWGGDKWHQDALGLSDSEYDSWLRENAGFIPRGALPADNADYKEGSTELVPAWSVESFPLDKAMENIHNRDFKGNVGNTIVAPSHKFIQWALDNPDIHMILAYHAAGGSPIMKALSGYDKATAMDDGYHTLGTDGKAIKTIEDKLTGVEISGGALQWNRLLRKNGYDAKKAAQTYLDFCKENGFTPMFNYEGVVDHPNYYKMLTDFRVYDEDGKSIKQKGVKAILPDNWQEILNKYLEQEQTSSEQVSKVTLDENIMKEIDAATKFTSIELEERDSIMSLLQKIYGKGNVEVLGQNEFDVSLDGATSDGRAQMLRDMGGMVYGYAAGNRIVLNEYVFNANTPLHEHAHLYMKVLSAFNPRLYQRGMELWRDTPQWNDAKSDIERLGEEPTDDRVFSECMAQFTGTANEDIISKVTGVTDKNWIQKALEWMKEMWDGVKSAFKRWTKGDLDALTADDFAHLPLRAFYDTEERNAYIKNVKALNDAGGFDGSIRFSLKAMMEKPEGWKQANKKAIHIEEAIERDPKFSLKNLDGTLIKAGTYFSGGGLVEEGLKGIIDPVVAVEYDEKISGVYRNNFGQHIVTADVRDVDPKELVKQIDGEVEYFHASPVCKNYSQAKSNHAEVELDKETAASTAEFINAVKPKVVTIENVKGYKDSYAMKTITDALDANGYTWDADVYNAADYGGYTNRERLIVRAVRDGKLPAKPKKMAHKSGWYEAVADIIPTLTEKKNGVAPWMDVRLKADGIDWRNIDKPLYVMGSAYADGKIPHAFADELLPTLRTKSGDVIVMPDGKVYRAMGRVLARVSGVSDDYKMPFSENLSHTIIGNGIPTQLTEHVIAPLLQNTLRPTTPDDGSTKFSLRYDKFEHDLNQWKKDNNLPKDAQRPTIPQRNAGESAVDFLRRVDEYRKQMALWKTAPTYEQHLLSDDTALGEFNRELQRGSVLKRIAFQDSMLAIRKAQEAIMKEVGVDRLNMAEDAYTAENRSHGKGKNEFEEYNNEFLQPLRKAYHQMKKVLGDSYDNVRVYMMAKHGLERDAQMAFKKSLEADYEDVNQRSAAYKAYKNDLDRVSNDADLEFGRVDFTTWRQKDNALRGKYSPSYMDYRYDDNGIAYDYSGLSSLFDGSDFEEVAHKLVRDVENKHLAEVQALWNATNAATKKILRDGFKAGMMSKDTYEYVKGMYSHYIPLRGWDGTTADQVWDYIGGGKGAFNQTLKTAHGRTSIADDPIAYIENMAESGILLNNKNWVKQHLMLLAQNHPTSLLTLSKAWYVKSTDANGNEEWIPATPQITSQMNSNQVKAAIDAFEQKMEQMAQTGDATQQRDGLNIAYPQTHSEEREHEVRVMKDGEEYVIYVNGDPQLAQAMNNTRAHRVREIQSGKLDRAAAWLGRKMAAAYTSLSPLFIPSNYFRDLTMTLASTAIREDGRYNYLLRKNLATSWNLGFMLRDYQNGKLREKVSNGNATAKEQMFYDFMMNGGETGFVSSLDVEDLKKKFKNDLKDLDRWKANPVKVGHIIMDGIEFLNRMIEDSNRFAVYMTSIQYGRSIDEAVNDAKDVTLNFNRKGTGEYGWQMIRNLYLFINPAVQSLQTLGALVKHHPFKFTAVTAAWLASGVLVPIVNAALMQLFDVIASAFGFGGDDDKDKYVSMKDKYWQFSKWDRRNNFIMWVPTTHEFVKIPLAQEFRAFYGIGDMIASKMMGGELAEETWSQYAEDLLGQVVDMLPLDPTGYDGNIAVSLMPNPIRPVFELAFNVDFTGKPLFKDTEYNKYDPNFTKAYVGTPDWLVRVSKMVNSIGNDYPDVQQNAIDAFGDPRYNLNNPAVVDHVLSSYLGGAYTMGSQVLGVLTKSLNDPKEIKMADIPLVSKFVSNPDDRPVTKKQGDEFWNMKENHDRAANTLSKLKKQAKVDGDYSMLERFYGSEEYKQYKQEDVKVKKYEEDKKKERAEESGEEYRPHKLNAEDIYKAHATPKDDFEDLKLKQLFTKLNGFKTSYDLLVDTASGQSDGYYNTNKVAIDAIDEISLDKQEISELKKGFLEDGKDAYNAEDMKRIRELRKRILSVLEPANKVVVANQKTKAEKK